MKKLPIAACLAGLIVLAGCNTISGAGKDVSSVGKAVSKTADSVK